MSPAGSRWILSLPPLVPVQATAFDAAGRPANRFPYEKYPPERPPVLEKCSDIEAPPRYLRAPAEAGAQWCGFSNRAEGHGWTHHCAVCPGHFPATPEPPCFEAGVRRPEACGGGSIHKAAAGGEGQC